MVAEQRASCDAIKKNETAIKKNYLYKGEKNKKGILQILQ